MCFWNVTLKPQHVCETGQGKVISVIPQVKDIRLKVFVYLSAVPSVHVHWMSADADDWNPCCQLLSSGKDRTLWSQVHKSIWFDLTRNVFKICTLKSTQLIQTLFHYLEMPNVFFFFNDDLSRLKFLSCKFMI